MLPRVEIESRPLTAASPPLHSHMTSGAQLQYLHQTPPSQTSFPVN